MDDQPTIYLDNAWVIRDLVSRAHALTGAPEPALALALEGWLAAVPGGPALDDTVRVALPYRGTVGTAAVYASNPIDEAALAAHLGGRAVVYEVVRSLDGDYQTSKKRTVKPNRPA